MAHKVLAWLQRAGDESAKALNVIEIDRAPEVGAFVTLTYRGNVEVGRILEVQRPREGVPGDLPRVVIKQSVGE
jgi:hypothetical protein